MDFSNFKRWHWILIGLILGAILGSARLYYGPAIDKPKEENFDADQFEKCVLLRPPPPNLSVFLWRAVAERAGYLTDIVIHPPTKESSKPESEIVTGNVWYPEQNAATKKWVFAARPFLYVVPVPYIPEPDYLAEFRHAPDHYEVDPKIQGGFKRVKTPQAPDYKPPEMDVFAQTAEQAKRRKSLEFEARKLSTTVDKGPAHFDEIKVAATEASTAAKTPEEKFAALQAQLADVQRQSADLKAILAKAPHIKDYLDLLNKRYPDAPIKYRVAWEEKPVLTFTIWTAGTTLLIGGIWPVVLSLMSGAGLGLKHTDEGDDYDLSRFKGAQDKSAEKQGTEVTADDKERLRALEAELEKNLQGGLSRGPAVGGTTDAPVPTLGAGATEESKTAQVEKPKPNKAFGAGGGDFYPTEVHGKKK